MKGCLYLVPTTLGDNDPADVIPVKVLAVIKSLRFFIVENEKTARAFLKRCDISYSQQELNIVELDKHNPSTGIKEFLSPLHDGNDVGLLSEAGVPAVADPGSLVVAAAHKAGIQVKPLTGPSSILLALMGSGLNGQSFRFHGYIPAEKTARIKTLKQLEKDAGTFSQTQIFIETPYRNNPLLKDIIENCNPELRLCLAVNMTLADESVRTLTVREWKQQIPDLNKKPCVFCIGY